MAELSADELELLRAIAAATPDDVTPIIAGGWASRLHRLHPWSSDPGFPPLLTKDLDVALREAHGSGTRLRDGLRANHFSEEMRGDERPPIERYLIDGRDDFELEFITDLTGAATDRKGKSRRTVAISGVVAQRTRHVGVLLGDSWTVPLGTQSVEVATPGRYFVQKLLSLLDRQFDAKKAKDAVYAHDTLRVFQQSQRLHVDFVAEILRVRDGLEPSQKKRLAEVCRLLINPVSKVVQDAVNQIQSVGRDLDTAGFVLLIRLSLDELGLVPDQLSGS